MSASIPLTRQLACAQRELALRRQVYTRFVREGKWKPHQAEYEIDTMQAIVQTLEALVAAEGSQPSLFRGQE